VSLSGYKMPVFCERKHFSIYFERERERREQRVEEKER